MFDHLGIVVSDLDAARKFFSACLAPLGVNLLEDHSQSTREGWLVYGTAGYFPFFVVAAGRPSFWRNSHVASASPGHIAFTAPNAAAVDAFHLAGMTHGGTDNGQPGSRLSSTPYYAAYLIEPDGNNVEAGYRGGAA